VTAMTTARCQRHPGGGGRVPAGRGRPALLAGAAVALSVLLGDPAPVPAWPAIQDATGTVSPCAGRPSPLPDGRWSCPSAGGRPVGALVDVIRPGFARVARPVGPPGPPYRYGFYPWGHPPSDPSGYDALDPWLGGGGPSQR
jgi:hypothetical protein